MRTRSDPSGRLWLLALLSIVLIAADVAGLEARWVVRTTELSALLGALALALVAQPTGATGRLIQSLVRWGVYWLALGLLLEPFEGGIKKDHSTLSYYFLLSGLALFALSALTVFVTATRKHFGFRLLIANGQNPMIAYVSMNCLIQPVLALTGLGDRLVRRLAGGLAGGGARRPGDPGAGADRRPLHPAQGVLADVVLPRRVRDAPPLPRREGYRVTFWLSPLDRDCPEAEAISPEPFPAQGGVAAQRAGVGLLILRHGRVHVVRPGEDAAGQVAELLEPGLLQNLQGLGGALAGACIAARSRRTSRTRAGAPGPCRAGPAWRRGSWRWRTRTARGHPPA